MGGYGRNLSRRLRNSKPRAKIAPNVERLVSVGIYRDGLIHGDGLSIRSHYMLRAIMGDEDPERRKRDDIEGFITSTGRFLDRDSAKDIAIAAGQVDPGQRREILSSDIQW